VATHEWTIDPEEYGLGGARYEELSGGSPDENAETIREVLAGRGARGARAAVILNAGAALYVGGLAPSYADGVAAATRALDRGDGARALDRLRRVYAG
jgi:anthranilate phosphoribosyltransferase